MCKFSFVLVVFIVVVLSGTSESQDFPLGRSEGIWCSPAPCVLPPTQVSSLPKPVQTASIAANPINPDQLLLGAEDYNCTNYATSLATFVSMDRGSTWTPNCLDTTAYRGITYRPIGSDVKVAYDRHGTAYIAAEYMSDYLGLGGIGFKKSADGLSWTEATIVGNGDGHSSGVSLALDSDPMSAFAGAIYISTAWESPPDFGGESQVVVARSDDGGNTWKLFAVDKLQVFPNYDGETNITIGKGGTVYVAWQYCVGEKEGPGCYKGKTYLAFSKSDDGGKTWSKPKSITQVVLTQYSQLPNGGPYVSDYPVLASDRSAGPFSNNLYVALYSWTGKYLRVGVARSTDGGETWSRPVPVAPNNANHDQFLPWLSVSNTGLVGVSWLDRRNDPADINYQAFAAISRDGELSFQPNIQLTDAFSNPNTNDGYGGMGVSTGNTWAKSNFLAAWMDSSNGVDMQDVVGGIRLK